MFNYQVKRAVFIALAFVWLPPLVQAQEQSKIDSLTRVLHAAKTDTARISAQNKLVKEYLMQNDSARAFQYAYSSLALAKNTSSLYHKAYANQILGYVHTVLMHEDSSLYYNNKVLAQLEGQTSDNAIRLMIYATNNISSVYATNGNIKRSSELLISNLPRIEKINDQWAYGITIQNIAACFNNLGEFHKSYPYMLKSVALVEEANRPPQEKLGPYLTGALLLYRLDSINTMGEYLARIKENLDKIAHATPASGRYYAYQAVYYAKVNKLKDAEVMLVKANKELKDFGSRTNYYDVYMARNNVAVAGGNYQLAREAALVSYKMGVEDKYSEMIISRAWEVATYSEHLGDYKTAYEYMKRYAFMDDSVKYAQTILDVHDLETKYRTAEKEKQIATLQIEKQKVLLKNKSQQFVNWLLIAGAGVLLLIILVLVYIYRNSRKYAMQQLREVKQQQELQVAQAMLEGEERERTRMARDLHDGLGGSLSGIKFKLYAQHKDNMPVTEQVIHQLDESIGELRRIARNMMPESLMKLGLETALHDLCASMSGQNREVEFQASGISKELMLASQINIYRIIQELLSNAIRHSNATRIIVQCIQDDHHFLITVEDNGKGFNTESSPQKEGIGLSNIYNRVNYLKGKLDIQSGIDEGTAVNIELYV